MFLRSVKAANGRHEYLRLVESFRDGDKVKQRIVAHLGRKDLLAPRLGSLIRLPQDESSAPQWIPAAQVSTPRASTWGPILVARHLFEQLSPGSILDAGRQPLRRGQPLSERVFPLLANRLTRPGSEHALAQWLVVKDLNARFELNRVVFVGDRGMMTLGNVGRLRDLQQGYLVGLQRRNRKDTAEYIRQASARTDRQECPAGITATEKKVAPKTRVVEVPGKDAGVRVFVAHSEERELYERGMRELSMERARKDLEAVHKQVEKGELKEPDKIGAAAATKLRRNHGHRYFDWEPRQGKFRFFEHPVNLAREKPLEGKYVIQTEERNLSAVEAVAAHKELNEVERGFSHLKSLLELRPVYHRKEARVRAHVFVAALAPLLDRALEKSLHTAGSGLSTPFAWQALEMVRCVEVELGQRRNVSGDGCARNLAARAEEIVALPNSPPNTRDARCSPGREDCPGSRGALPGCPHRRLSGRAPCRPARSPS